MAYVGNGDRKVWTLSDVSSDPSSSETLYPQESTKAKSSIKKRGVDRKSGKFVFLTRARMKSFQGKPAFFACRLPVSLAGCLGSKPAGSDLLGLPSSLLSTCAHTSWHGVLRFLCLCQWLRTYR